MSQTYMDRDRCTDAESSMIAMDRCPDCKGRLVDGPCGGGSINKYCINDNCGSRFNDMSPFNAERISPRSPNRRAEPQAHPVVAAPPEEGPYRTGATAQVAKPKSWWARFWEARGKRLCQAGRHKVCVVRVLKGGEGPDEASKEIECARPGCKAWGWIYCDGDVSWRNPQ